MASGTHRSRLPFLLLTFAFLGSFLSILLFYNTNLHSFFLITSPPRFTTKSSNHHTTSLISSPSLAPRHILFGIASSFRAIIYRVPLISLWWDPSVRLFVFVDSSPLTLEGKPIPENKFPFPVLVSANTSHFPYTFKDGLRSGIRVARIVKELIDRPDISKKDVRWIVLGDDDTVFILNNLLETLDKYDWREWYYVGGRSEMWAQNAEHGFDMAYGGGGIAISLPLAKVLARNIDSCIERYHYLFGSDGRIAACLSELGVQLTHEPGFHQVNGQDDTTEPWFLQFIIKLFKNSYHIALLYQVNRHGCTGSNYTGPLPATSYESSINITSLLQPMAKVIDMHGDISGLLSSHPLNPLVSLHHFDMVFPIFPFLNRTASVAHLMTAVRRDPSRALQKTVCYDTHYNRTLSISWGYSISVFEGNMLLLDLLSVEKTFVPWVLGSSGEEAYMFNTRDSRRLTKCQSPAVFFLKSVLSNGSGNSTRIETSYSRYLPGWCLWTAAMKNLRLITVNSRQLEHLKEKPLRRHCCDVSSSSGYMINVNIRECKEGESIAVHT